MNKDIIEFFVYGAVFFGVIFCIIYLCSLYKKEDEYNYITGHYAKYCYQEGTEPASIKDKIYFNSLKECSKPLQRVLGQ